MGKDVKGPRGPMGHVGVIPVEKGNKVDFVLFAKKRFNDFLIEDLIKYNEDVSEYLIIDIRYCFEDIHRAACKYLGIREDE